MIKKLYENLYSCNKPIEEIKQVTASDAILSITNEEAKNAIKAMRKNKAPGPDKIEIDIITAASETLESELANLYTRWVILQKAPTAWKESETVLAFKKGNKRELKSYRPISLVSHIYKNIHENIKQETRTKT